MSINIPGSGIWVPGTDMLVNGGLLVNQRQQTSYRVPHNTYTVDRWKSNLDAQIDVVSDGIKVHSLGNVYAGIWQHSENMYVQSGDTYTFSVDFPETPVPGWYIDLHMVPVTEGNPGVTASTVGKNLQKGINAVTATVPNGINGLYYFRGFICNALAEDTVAHIHRAKLEPGPISTLMYDAPPDMAVEEARCKRYFERLGNAQSGKLTNWTYIPQGSAQAIFSIAYSAKRVVPTVALSAPDQYRVLLRESATGNIFRAPTVIALATNEVSKTTATVTAAIGTTDRPAHGMLQRTDVATSAWINIDAEIH
ncbi:hypothetical protein RWV98_03015 [Agathobaculum sp. NTUH-O15-33]|uniref:hypothetical protein n=1 Tax=Agathobaculum sp. NTUH-O15-33 TaxID=3079302 RepID=UPI0029588B63|nr:hypothetical protein [Agathobaculum sp. NTUH-O15-33]WNX84355.1 hypothetical protein RWV98_17540 [Agathobaculum sp. NTUH-O15-33]WNX85263.1 hypothetical protein RWV98_03015 [Agathobaculum sp. NTUH-O15-33]